MFNSFLTFGEENLEVEERNGIKRNDFPRIFRENSTKFSVFLCFSTVIQ
jgi:hypothetical protein